MECCGGMREWVWRVWREEGMGRDSEGVREWVGIVEV